MWLGVNCGQIHVDITPKSKYVTDQSTVYVKKSFNFTLNIRYLLKEELITIPINKVGWK